METAQRPPNLNAAHNHAWVGIDECVQHGIRPERQYPSCERLFKCLLATKSVQMTPLQEQVAKINKSMTLSEITDTLSELSESLRWMSSTAAASAIQPLRRKAMFPVFTRRNRELEPGTSFDDLSTAQDSDWLLVDRPHLTEVFLGKVPLLAISPNHIAQLEPLFETPNLSSRRLSKLVTSETRPSGPLEYMDSESVFLMARKDCIRAYENDPMLPPCGGFRGLVPQ